MGYCKAILLPHVNEANLQQIKVEYRYGPSSKDRPRFKTDQYSRRKDWDHKNGISKVDDGINKILAELKENIRKITEMLILQDIEPTGPAVKKAYENELHKKKKLARQLDQKSKRNNKQLIKWYEEYLEDLKSPARGIKKGTINNRNQFKKILKSYNKKVTLPGLTKTYLDGLLNYMIKQEYKSTTISKHFATLRAMINWVKSFEENEDIPIPSAYEKVKLKETYNSPVGLSRSEFTKLIKADLAFNKDLELSRDWFVIGIALGGLRVSDLFGLRFEEVINDSDNNYYVSYVEEKTSCIHHNKPIPRFGVEVINKYQGNIPKQGNNTFRLNLKVIAEYLDFNRTYDYHTFDIKGKVVKTEKKVIKKEISSKFIRKTSISIDASLGTPPEVNMLKHGHKTYKAHKRYVNVDNKSLVDSNSRWDNFIDQYNETR